FVPAIHAGHSASSPLSLHDALPISVVLVAELFANQVGDGRGNPAELGMAEGILEAGFGEEFAFLVLDALGNPDHAVTVGLDALVDASQEGGLVKFDLGEQQDVRRFALGFAGQTAGGGDPAGVTAHDLEDEHLGRGGAHGGHSVTGLADGGGHILGYRAETRAAVGDRQVIVHGLGYMDRLDRV